MSKKEQIKKQQSQFLEILKKIREEKDVDAIAELFLEIISVYGLKMDETAALLYYVQKKTLEADHNAQFLNERLKLDVTSLGIEGVLQVQRALVNTYIDGLKKGK
ncbi:hypothetical protein ACQUI5_001216 [Enterococcus faecalis]|uniref:hypothetical protein n=1 Tax=Enterococcus faecalis TaxID=1351 RepID=UPI00155E869A|nr:hypothetical protein [Enterococcus faecalis]EHL2501680.1 hypothetical protein [Enterococcus faecalis]NRC82516.1 hypothetical protein [Enterococcus faecalis]NSS90041.1 hypothetical protein [Enterococcus faecalis]